MIELKTPQKRWDPTTVPGTPLFSVDGTIYHIPDSVPQSVALEAMELMASQGEAQAAVFILKRVLGTAAYAALKGSIESQEDMNAITEIVRRRLFGDLEAEGKG